MGYVSDRTGWKGLDRLGGYADLDRVLERYRPDEVVSAIPAEEFSQTPAIISACEKAGVKLSMIPFYAEYMPSNPQFDDLDGLPLMNIRRIPLDNWGNAFLKRCMDLVGLPASHRSHLPGDALRGHRGQALLSRPRHLPPGADRAG